MSFGDGTAISIGQIGYSCSVLPDNIGTAIVNTNSNKLSMIITPIDSSQPYFNKRINISDIISSFVHFSSPTIFVENKVKKDILIPCKIQSTNVVNSNIFFNFIKGRTFVIDTNDLTNKLLNNISESIKGCSTIVFSPDEQLIDESDKVHNVYSTEKTQLIEQIPLVSTQVSNIDTSKTLCHPEYAFVENRSIKMNTSSKILPSVITTVADYKPPVIGVTNGSGLVSFRIIVQKYSYFEQDLSFYNSTISTITGLPQGMQLEKSYLKGSPLVSGDYNITIKFTDNTIIPGLLTVTQEPRNL